MEHAVVSSAALSGVLITSCSQLLRLIGQKEPYVLLPVRGPPRNTMFIKYGHVDRITEAARVAEAGFKLKKHASHWSREQKERLRAGVAAIASNELPMHYDQRNA